MKRIENKTLLKFGVVAMLLIVGVSLVAAMTGNSTVGCGVIIIDVRNCVATDPNGIDKITVWDSTTGKKVVEVKNKDGFSPTSMVFTIPGTGNFTIALKDEEHPPDKDFWIVNSTGVHGPMDKKPKKMK